MDKKQHNKRLVDQYRLTLTMLGVTKGALMAQSSKQTCIILRIVRILSPTNNSAIHQEKVHVNSESVCVLLSACVPLNLCDKCLSACMGIVALHVNIFKVSLIFI